MLRLGIDVGGTKIAAGLVDARLRVTATKSAPTDVEGGPGGIVREIAALAEALCREAEVPWDEIASVGIGCAGTVDADAGIVKYANNLRFEEVPLAGPVSELLGKRVDLENDANCAGLGEYAVLRDRDEIESFVMITLGTGIGSAVVIDGKLYRGFNGAAPELGHCVIAADGIPCDCGASGCWEMYCAGHALTDAAVRAARLHPESRMWQIAGGSVEGIDGRCAFAAHDQGDPAAVEVIERYLHYFRIGIANVVNTFQPRVIVLGGGISEQGELLLRAAREAVRTGSYCKSVRLPEVRRAVLGPSAGIVGAACLGGIGSIDPAR